MKSVKSNYDNILKGENIKCNVTIFFGDPFIQNKHDVGMGWSKLISNILMFNWCCKMKQNKRNVIKISRLGIIKFPVCAMPPFI